MIVKNTLKSLMMLVLSFSMVIGMAVSSANAKERQYHIYGDAKPGTKFKEKLYTSSIPFDKPYAQLTEKQKAYVRSPYDGMPDSETPPFPSKGYGVLVRPIIKAHSRVSRQGDLVAIAMIGADGKTKSVEVLSAPSKKMAEFVTVLFFETEFDAATSNGKACDMEYLLNVKMDVTHGL